MSSPNLAITHVAASQNQKEVTINDAIDALDKAGNDAVDIDCSAGDTVVSTADYRQHFLLSLTGSPAAAFTLALPEGKRVAAIHNTTSRSATLRTATLGTTLALPAEQLLIVGSRGSELLALAASAIGGLYDMGLFVPGQPAATALVFQFAFPRAVSFPANLSASTARAATAASSAASFTLRRNGDIIGKWGGIRYTTVGDVAYVSGAGRFGGGAARLTSTSGALVRKLSGTPDELFVWLAIFPRSYPTSNASLLFFQDSAGVAAVLRVNPSGAVYGSQMGATTALTTTSSQSFALDEWNTLAVHYKCADSGGRWRETLNGVDQWDFTGDTRLSGGTTIDRLAIGGIRSGAGNEWDIDDFVLCDNSGSYMNALLTGDLKIEALRPTADSGSGGWTPSTGTNHAALIDDTGPDDSDFLTATTAGARDLFTLADPAAAPLLTHALVVNARARRTDTAAKALRPLVRVNAADDLSPDRTLTNQFAVLQHPVYRNPDGGAAWTGATLNAALIGVEAGS